MITSKNEPQSVGGGFLSPDVFYGLSTDSKPVDKVANGSTFKEIDTGKEYLFDYSGGEWHEAPSSGGGGGGGDNGLFIVNVVQNETTEKWEADKTLDEVEAAASAGKVVAISLTHFYRQFFFPEINGEGSDFNVCWQLHYMVGLSWDPPEPELGVDYFEWYKEDGEEVISYYTYSYVFPTEP